MYVYSSTYSLTCFGPSFMVLAEKMLFDIFLKPVCVELKQLDFFSVFFSIYWNYLTSFAYRFDVVGPSDPGKPNCFSVGPV